MHAALFGDLRTVAAWVLRTAQPGDFARFGEDVEMEWQSARHTGSLRERPGQASQRRPGTEWNLTRSGMGLHRRPPLHSR